MQIFKKQQTFKKQQKKERTRDIVFFLFIDFGFSHIGWVWFGFAWSVIFVIHFNQAESIAHFPFQLKQILREKKTRIIRALGFS